MITDEELARADRDAADAARAADEAEEAGLVGASVMDTLAVRARRARSHAAQLRRTKAAEDAAAVERAVAEKAAARDVKKLAAQLAAARASTAAAIAQAEAATVAALAAVSDYNAAVAGASGDLLARGLPVELSGATHPTGGTARGNAVRLADEWSSAVDPGAVLAWSVHRAALAALGRRHGITLRLEAMARSVRLEAHGGRHLVEAVPELVSTAPSAPTVPAEVAEQMTAAREPDERQDERPYLLRT